MHRARVALSHGVLTRMESLDVLGIAPEGRALFQDVVKVIEEALAIIRRRVLSIQGERWIPGCPADLRHAARVDVLLDQKIGHGAVRRAAGGVDQTLCERAHKHSVAVLLRYRLKPGDQLQELITVPMVIEDHGKHYSLTRPQPLRFSV